VSTIAIIGAGNVGKALAGSFAAVGRDVVISAAHPEHAQQAAATTGARAAASNAEAVGGADIVVLAVPASEFGPIASELRGSLAGKIVVDATNQPTPDLQDLDAAPTSAAERLQALLPESRVVKAFNTAFASRMAAPVVEGIALDGFVAADDGEAKATVLALVEDIGFRPVDAGPLANARALEAIAWLNIYLNLTHGWSWQAGWKLVEPVAVAA
jgi:hypothetical protein